MDTQSLKHIITRREFGKAAAALSGAAMLAARAARAQESGDTLKVGLLGCGGRGTGALNQLLEANENVVLIALADVFEDRTMGVYERMVKAGAENLAGKVAVEPDHCFTGLDAYKQILATDIDILIEGTLPYCRPKHIAAAVEAGKHIFSEKPVASDPVGVRMVMEAGEKHKKAGLSFVAGTQRRHQKEYIETIAKIHDGAIGEVRAMRAYWCGSLPFVHDRQEGWSDLEYRIRNWYNYCWVSGDNIVEQHVHNLDVCNWVLNAHPEAVVASGGRAWKPAEERYGDLYDHFSCDYQYPGGVHMFSFSRHWNNSHGDVFEEAFGSKGSTLCHALGEAGNNPYYQEHIDLVNSIRGTGPYYHQAQEVAESTLTGIMGRMAAYTGQRVTWEDALNSDLSLVPDDLDFAKEYPVGPVPVPGA